MLGVHNCIQDFVYIDIWWVLIGMPLYLPQLKPTTSIAMSLYEFSVYNFVHLALLFTYLYIRIFCAHEHTLTITFYLVGRF